MTVLRVPYETIEMLENFLEMDIPDSQLMFQCFPNEPPPLAIPKRRLSWLWRRLLRTNPSQRSLRRGQENHLRCRKPISCGTGKRYLSLPSRKSP